MGPEYWKPGSPTALKKCSERVSNSCTDETDGCCGVIPCTYCIEWDPETGSTVYATADFATNSWTATVAGVAWVGYWERNYDTDECEFVVTLDGEEIYRKSCYEGQSCRDSSDSAPATIDYIDGVITWTKFLARPLDYVQDEETNCTVHFCDECECSAECLCVTITEPDTTVTTGEICDTAYDCDPPLWEGTVGTFELSIALGRDEYWRCIITATVDGIEQEPVLFPGCGDASATITLADETTIEVSAKKCSCDEGPCCPNTIKEGTTIEVIIAGQIIESVDLWHIDSTRTLEWDALLQSLVYYGPGGPTRGAPSVVADYYDEEMSAVFFCETEQLIALQISTSYPGLSLNAFNCSKFFDCATWDLTKTIEFSNCFEMFDAFPLPTVEPNVYQFDPIACESATNPNPEIDTVTETADKIRIRTTTCTIPDHGEYVGYSYLIRIIPP